MKVAQLPITSNYSILGSYSPKVSIWKFFQSSKWKLRNFQSLPITPFWGVTIFNFYCKKKCNKCFFCLWKKETFLVYLFSISNAWKRMINAIFVCEKKRQFLVYLFSISNARKRLINSIFVCEKKRQFLIYLFSISNARKRPMNTIFVS